MQSVAFFLLMAILPLSLSLRYRLRTTGTAPYATNAIAFLLWQYGSRTLFATPVLLGIAYAAQSFAYHEIAIVLYAIFIGMAVYGIIAPIYYSNDGGYTLIGVNAKTAMKLIKNIGGSNNTTTSTKGNKFTLQWPPKVIITLDGIKHSGPLLIQTYHLEEEDADNLVGEILTHALMEIDDEFRNG